jgi:hypothetical protein
MPQRTPSLRSVSPRPGRYFHILKMNLDAERGTPLRYDHEVHHLILAPPSQVGNILLGAPSIGSKPRQASQIRRRGLRRERRSAEVFRRYRISFGIVHPGVSERVASAARAVAIVCRICGTAWHPRALALPRRIHPIQPDIVRSVLFSLLAAKLPPLVIGVTSGLILPDHVPARAASRQNRIVVSV